MVIGYTGGFGYCLMNARIVMLDLSSPTDIFINWVVWVATWVDRLGTILIIWASFIDVWQLKWVVPEHQLLGRWLHLSNLIEMNTKKGTGWYRRERTIIVIKIQITKLTHYHPLDGADGRREGANASTFPSRPLQMSSSEGMRGEGVWAIWVGDVIEREEWSATSFPPLCLTRLWVCMQEMQLLAMCDYKDKHAIISSKVSEVMSTI